MRSMRCLLDKEPTASKAETPELEPPHLVSLPSKGRTLSEAVDSKPKSKPKPKPKSKPKPKPKPKSKPKSKSKPRLVAGLLLALGVSAGATFPFSGCQVDPYAVQGDAGSGAGDGGSTGDGTTTDGEVDSGLPPCDPPGEPEVCNGMDDDCDGQVDEDFNLQNDPQNCGECGKICAAPNSDVICEQGECVRVSCWVGYKDLDPDAPGCEYQCPVYPELPEECNGVDDDCDGEADEPQDLIAPPAGLCRVMAGTPCEGTAPICDTRGSPPATTWYCDYGPAVEFDPTVPNGIVLQEQLCDGFDGDCDGAVDETYEDLGQLCDNGDIGSCRDMGVKICDPQDPSQTICDFSQPPDPDPLAPRPEECNGADDNCDGIIDNSDPDDPDRVLDDMIHVQHSGLDFWIYRYEASRPDATGMSAGGSDARACSKQGALPWGGATYAQAEAACQAVGKRLCSPAEWLAACAGSSGFSHPYGNTYDGDMCNGRDLDGIPGGDDDDILLPAGDTGLLFGCVTEDSVHDMSGNLREWTTEQSGDTGDPDYTPIYVVRGGDYKTPEPGLGCTFTLSQAVADVILPTIGFRCCSDIAP